MSNINETGLYINFFHGRNTVIEELEDWGFPGPLVGPCTIAWTYGSIKIISPNSDMEFLPCEEGMPRIEGKYYGDFEVYGANDPLLDNIRRAGSKQMTARELILSIRKDEQAKIDAAGNY